MIDGRQYQIVLSMLLFLLHSLLFEQSGGTVREDLKVLIYFKFHFDIV